MTSWAFLDLGFSRLGLFRQPRACYQTTVPVSTNIPKSLRFCVVAALAAGCAPGSGPPTPAVRISVAALANDDCGAARTRGLPAAVDALDVERRDPVAGWQLVDRVARAGGLSAGEVLLEGVDAGEAVELRFVACAGAVPMLAAEPPPFTVEENEKHLLALHFKTLGRLSCTGTAFGSEYGRYAGLGRPRAFPAAAGLPDGRLLVAGGASLVELTDIDGDDSPDVVLGAGPAAGTDDGAWDVYDPAETLFLPGVERHQPIAPRRMSTSRLLAHAFPFRGGVLVLGGSDRVTWDPGPRGPFRLVGGLPAAERFEPSTATFLPAGLDLAPRFLTGAAQLADGRVVIAGGLEATDPATCVPGLCDLQPSRRVEVIDPAGLVTAFDLPVPILGPTVTPLGPGEVLVWGADLEGCGARPGWVVGLDPVLAVRPLTLQGPQGPPDCQTPVGACRAWYPTAHHAAAHLPTAGDARRVLITGGVAVGAQGLVPNPDQGQGCPPNVFVLTVDAAAGTGAIEPVQADTDAVGQAVKRALHGASATGGRVLISGGWLNEGTPTALVAGNQLLIYDDADGVLRAAPDRLSSPRVGHLSAALADGTVLFAGGVTRAADGGFTLLATAEVYVPPLDRPACLPDADASVMGATEP